MTKYNMGIPRTDKSAEGKINAGKISNCKFNDRGSYRIESHPGGD